MNDTTDTVSRRARKARQRNRLKEQVTVLRDALSLINAMSAGSKNDPAMTIRNIHAVTASALDATSQ